MTERRCPTTAKVEEMIEGAGVDELTVAIFQTNAGTGTATSPEKINNGSTAGGDDVIFDVVNEYVEVLLPGTYKATQYRIFHCNQGNSNDDGKCKVQYLNTSDVWTDWVTNITLLQSGTWTNWDSSGGDVEAKGIRLIMTVLDTGSGNVMLRELEAKY